jgi:glycosyltransferase involved in cell wall biosynthesis
MGHGPEKEALVKLANRLGVANRGRFDRDLSREQLLHMYARADVLVLLSRSEAYGLCVAEALAAGTPCVVAKTSALKEWVDKRNCFGVHYPIDLDELANAIRRAFGKNVNKVLPTWDEVASKVANVYEELLARS